MEVKLPRFKPSFNLAIVDIIFTTTTIIKEIVVVIIIDNIFNFIVEIEVIIIIINFIIISASYTWYFSIFYFNYLIITASIIKVLPTLKKSFLCKMIKDKIDKNNPLVFF